MIENADRNELVKYRIKQAFETISDVDQLIKNDLLKPLKLTQNMVRYYEMLLKTEQTAIMHHLLLIRKKKLFLCLNR